MFRFDKQGLSTPDSPIGRRFHHCPVISRTCCSPTAFRFHYQRPPLSRWKKKLPDGSRPAAVSLKATPSYFQRPSACLPFAGSLPCFFGHRRQPETAAPAATSSATGKQWRYEFDTTRRRGEGGRSGVAIQVLPQGIVKIIAAILILT